MLYKDLISYILRTCAVFLAIYLVIKLISNVLVFLITRIMYKNKSVGFTIKKGWLYGLLADFIGLVSLFSYAIIDLANACKGEILFFVGLFTAVGSINYNNRGSIIYFSCGVLISAVLLFIFSYNFIFKKDNLSKIQRFLSSLIFSILTAPYIFLVPIGQFMG